MTGERAPYQRVPWRANYKTWAQSRQQSFLPERVEWFRFSHVSNTPSQRRSLQACHEGCTTYTVEPAACDMRCSAFQQRQLSNSFVINEDAEAWFNASLLALQSNPAIQALFMNPAILMGLNLGGVSISDLVGVAFLTVRTRFELDNYCTAGCHFQQQACAACSKSGKALCSCSVSNCRNCQEGVCKSCISNQYFLLSDEFCYSDSELYALDGREDNVGGGGGGENPFEKLNRRRKRNKRRKGRKGRRNGGKK